MTSLMIFLLLAVPAVLFWTAGRAATERATAHGQRICKQARVQWLDQSVHQVRLRLRRTESGWLAWERQFRFDYSTGGEDRHAGLITLLGSTLNNFVGPMPQSDRESISLH